jgi:glutamate carboxypeptidase
MHLPAMLDDIRRLVGCESPSADLAAVARSADVVAEVGGRVLGAAPDRVDVAGRSHLRWRFGRAPAKVVVLGHHDTVWPIGSLATHPVTVEGGVLRGPGCFDMKTGVVMAMHAIASLDDRAGITLLVTGDEEVGSLNSRELIEAEAAGCAAALVLEASGPGGALKTARKGVAAYQVMVTGRAAHAGLEPELGINAAVELAHQLLAVAALADGAGATTVTPTLTSAGTTANTVPAEARFAVDVRVREPQELARVDAAMHALVPVVAGAGLRVRAHHRRPPLPAAASAGLFARAQLLAAELGLAPLTSAEVGGGSDGNFTAGIGVPTLDGLGAVGGGAHSDDEHVLIDAIPGRTALVAALIRDTLGRNP